MSPAPRLLLVLVVLSAITGPSLRPVSAQSGSRPPVIDMHVHSTTTTPADVARLASLNVRYLFLASLQPDLAKWSAVDPGRYLPALIFPCAGGRAPVTGRPCFESATEFPDIQWLRRELQAGRIRGFGELAPQYLGMSPDDERLEPYWALAEELDIPVGIHMGPGPPGAAYESSPAPFKSPGFRMAAGDPLLLEAVLLRHKRLRLFVMHAGWPRLDEMLALLYAHPNVYVDIAGLQSPAITPRAGYARYLQALVESGFARRIMFGTDFPNQLEAGVQVILDAEFLTIDQKNDVLCRNAARFLRLASSVCNP